MNIADTTTGDTKILCELLNKIEIRPGDVQKKQAEQFDEKKQIKISRTTVLLMKANMAHEQNFKMTVQHILL